MHRYIVITTTLVAFSVSACGPKPKSPVSGADLVATAVAAHYAVKVDGVIAREDGAYDWAVSAVNGSKYAWKGTLTIKLVSAEKNILEGHDFPLTDMVDPGGKTSGLKFTSRRAPMERGGDVAELKVEVNVTDYLEPSAAKK